MSTIKEPKKMDKKETFWTTTEKETSKETYGCEILIENGSLDEVMTTDAPTDAFIVTYEIDGTAHRDLTRGARVKLFDMYYDKFKMGLKIIDYGKGKLNLHCGDIVIQQHPKRKSGSSYKNSRKKIPPKFSTLKIL